MSTTAQKVTDWRAAGLCALFGAVVLGMVMLGIDLNGWPTGGVPRALTVFTGSLLGAVLVVFGFAHGAGWVGENKQGQR